MFAKIITSHILPLLFSIIVYALSLGLVAFSIDNGNGWLIFLSMAFTVSPLAAVTFFTVELKNKLTK